MNETLEQLAEKIRSYNVLDENAISHPDEKDKKNMLSIIKDLISIKEKEISAYNMMFCNAAHSFSEEEINLIDLTRSQCKNDLRSLEKLRSAIKSITV